MARRELWRLSPDTDRALREAAEAAIREIQQTQQRAHDEIGRECEAWAQKKYGETPRTRAFAARLHGIAMWTLVSTHVLTLGPTLVALQALKRHLARLRPSKAELREMEALLAKANISRRLHGQVLAEGRRAARDSRSLEVERIFSMRGGIGRRFFDYRGRLRAKKLPFIPALRTTLVAAFSRPEMVDRRWGSHPRGLSVTVADAYHLTAICLKAAFPKQFRRLDGASVKQAIAYHRAMQRRPPRDRGRYGRV
jgi:hypothetical protein